MNNKCKLCGGTTSPISDVLQCDVCQSLMPLEDIVFKYDESYSHYRKYYYFSPVAMLAREKVKYVASYMGSEFTKDKDKVWMDVGCGAGNTMYAADKYGYNVCGLDVKGSVIKDLPFPTGDLESPFEKYNAKEIDVISCWHSWVHSQQPTEMLNNMFQLLAPDGVLSIETPEAVSMVNRHKENGGSLANLCIFPEHSFVPSAKAMVDALLDQGLIPLDIQRFTNGILYHLLSKNGVSGKTMRGASQNPTKIQNIIRWAAVCATEPLSRAIRYRYTESVHCLFRKPGRYTI